VRDDRVAGRGRGIFGRIRKPRLPVVFVVTLSISIASLCVRYFFTEPEDCRSVTPGEFKAFIERSFRMKNDDPKWSRLSPGGRVDPTTIAVGLPTLGIPGPTSPDWMGWTSGKSESNGRTYVYTVMYSCGRGLEYSGPIEQK